MSHDWFNNVYQSTGKSAHDIMGQIELMLEALKSTFIGAGFPSDPVAGMICVNTTDHRCYMRNEANDAWVYLFDLSTMAFNIGAGMVATAMLADSGVTADKIADTARKPTLVSGETIAPANCNATSEVTAPTGTFINLSASNFVAPPPPYSIIANLPAGVDEKTSSNTSPWTAYRCRVYVSSEATTMRLSTRIRNSHSGYTAYARFTINGSNSSNNARTSQSYGWVDSANIDVSSLSGYYEVGIALWTNNGSTIAYFDGMALFIE